MYAAERRQQELRSFRSFRRVFRYAQDVEYYVVSFSISFVLSWCEAKLSGEIELYGLGSKFLVQMRYRAATTYDRIATENYKIALRASFSKIRYRPELKIRQIRLIVSLPGIILYTITNRKCKIRSFHFEVRFPDNSIWNLLILLVILELRFIPSHGVSS